MATPTVPPLADTTAENTSICATCDEVFMSKADLNNHETIHGYHKCSICSKRFKRESQLKEHKQIHPVTFKAQPSSLVDVREARLFTQLAALVGHESSKSVFAVGGAVTLNNLQDGTICVSDEPLATTTPIQTTLSASADNKLILTSIAAAPEIKTSAENKNIDKPVPMEHTMRCDPVTVRWDSISGSGCKVTLPCADTDTPSFEQLLKDCEPASFGRGGESVMDETYRKAGKLDSSAFSCDFNPYSLGIIDTIAQALIPTLAQRTNQSHGLRAEPYKLNVYSSPSGKFKAHVDTPRSKHQVGSLVVCLPAIHEGGQLVVRHQGREQVFDWSGEKAMNLLQWAAFFSDCEHEVLEVTSGHRVTLTYNLYSTCKANAAPLDPQQVELYTALEKLLANKAFCKDGNVLGYHCVHVYPHTNSMAFETLPATLKGTDKLLFESLSQLGLGVKLRHELDDGVGEMYYHDDEDEYWDDYEDDYLPPSRQGDRKGEKAVLAKGLRPIYLNSEMDYDGGYDMAHAWDPKHTVERVVWLNRANLNQPAIMHGTYGNEPGVALLYANLVITVTIPPSDKRKALPEIKA